MAMRFASERSAANVDLGAGLHALVEAVLEQCETLREDLVLIGQLRDHGGVVKEEQQDEESGKDEERGGRIGDPDEVGETPERIPPDRKDEHDEPGQQPEHGVSLLETTAADQLEDDEQEHDRGKCRSNGDAKWCHSSS